MSRTEETIALRAVLSKLDVEVHAVATADALLEILAAHIKARGWRIGDGDVACGTRTKYTRGCRCADCRHANARKERKRRPTWPPELRMLS